MTPLAEYLHEVDQTFRQDWLSALPHLDHQLDTDSDAFNQFADACDKLLQEIDSSLKTASAHVHDAFTNTASSLAGEQHTLEEEFSKATAGIEHESELIAEEETQYAQKLATLTHALEETQSQAAAGAHQLDGALAGWTSHTEQILTSLEDKKAALDGAAAALVAQRDASFGDVRKQAEQLSRAVEETLAGLASQARTDSQQLAQGTHQFLLGGIGPQVRNEVDQLSKALADLRSCSERVSSVFSGDVAHVLESVRKIADLLSQIEPLMRQVDALL